MYIDDCLQGVDMIMHCDRLMATQTNLGTSELVSINDLVSYIEDIAGIKLHRTYNLVAPKGVAGRNSDNIFVNSVLGPEPTTYLRDGLRKTYAWLEERYYIHKADKKIGSDYH